MNARGEGRRKFLSKAARAAAGAALLGAQAWVRAAAPDVCVARGGLVAQRLWAAIDALGGMSAFVAPGSRVLIKVNAAFSEPPETGGTVTPQVARALVQFVKGAGARSIVVLDHCCSNRGLFGTNADPTGITQATAGERVRLFDPQNDPKNYVSHPVSGAPMRAIEVCRELFRADCVISLARLKNHPVYGYTLTLKNMMGVTRNMYQFHRSFPEAIAALGVLVQPRVDLCIIDGTHRVTGWSAGGRGKLEPLGAIVAGRNLVSTDAAALTFYDVDPLRTYLRVAHERGVGVAALSALNIVRLRG